MSNWDKALIVNTFKLIGEENKKYIIIIATNANGIRINNPDIKLVIQWDFPISFDLMIQYISQVGKNEKQATFILFITK